MATRYSGFQPRQGRAPTPARHPFARTPRHEQYLAEGLAAIAAPFVGITANGAVEPGLFPMQQTGVSTAPLREAAAAFLAALDPERRQAAAFPVDSDQWRAWSNIHPYILRHGVLLEALDPPQRDAALALVRESLSAGGFQLARDVMRLNEVIGEITGKWDDYGEWLYWLSVFGTPSADEPWGWQIDGHHLIINCFVLGDQLVMTPSFLGSEPCCVDTGPYAGTRVFAAEEANGLALMQALTPAQRGQATIGSGPPYEGFTGHFHANGVLPYRGIRDGALAAEEQAVLERLVEAYVGHMRPGHARERLDGAREHPAGK